MQIVNKTLFYSIKLFLKCLKKTIILMVKRDALAYRLLSSLSSGAYHLLSSLSSGVYSSYSYLTFKLLPGGKPPGETESPCGGEEC